MKTEIEVKFLNIDPDDLREKLHAVGAICAQPMRLMRRQVFYPADGNRDSYIRVRDEGDKTTMTFKRFDAMSLHGAKEVEVVVSDFEDAMMILEQSGLKKKSYQETRRETWHIGTTEIVIDEWPWLQTFIEIEGENEADVRRVADKLGFDWNEDAVFGSATQAYRVQYKKMPKDFIMDDVPEIRFDAPRPEQLKEWAEA